MLQGIAGRVLQGGLALLMAWSLLAPARDQLKPMTRIETETPLESAGAPLLNRRLYLLDNQDSVSMGRLETAQAGDVAVEQLTISAASGTVRHYDSAGKQWVSQPAKAGRYTQEMLLLSFPGNEFFFYLPKTYRPLPNEGLELQPGHDGYLELQQAGDDWTVTLYARSPGSGFYADYVSLWSGSALMDMARADTHELWMRQDVGRWCYDGYYRPAPTTYVPAGDNVLYRCPAGYLLKSFTDTGDAHRLAADMARCTLDTMTLYQTPEGFWATPSESQWLSGDYNIGAGFYDTRFNTDLVMVMVEAYQRYGGDSVLESLHRYGDFYLRFAQAHHTETASGGWLVEDYWHPDAVHYPTHTSLNHQVAECDVLYRMAQVLERPELAETADKLLAGIRDTGTDWVREDSNLHYSVSPDGVYGGNDYPDLTYNDLFTLRAVLRAQGRPDEPVLAQLMATKKVWMDQTGVTTYLK